MCGRLFQTLPLIRLLQIAGTKTVSNSERHSSNFNVCPTSHIPVIKRNKLYAEEQLSEHKEEDSNDQNELSFMKWGHNSKFNLIINGRIEELTSKRTFANLISNRCVVIMEGYYQWNEKKQPFSFKPNQGDHFLVAALYSEEGDTIILTKDAIKELSHVHHRMPVILSHEEVSLWLDPKQTNNINQLIQQSLLNKNKPLWKNIGVAKLAPYVNSIQEKGEKCLMNLEEYKKSLDQKGLMRYWKQKPVIEAIDSNGNTILKQQESKNIQIHKKSFQLEEIEPKKQQNLVKQTQKLQQIQKINQQKKQQL